MAYKPWIIWFVENSIEEFFSSAMPDFETSVYLVASHESIFWPHDLIAPLFSRNKKKGSRQMHQNKRP